jgi:hypothetical protein
MFDDVVHIDLRKLPGTPSLPNVVVEYEPVSDRS